MHAPEAASPRQISRYDERPARGAHEAARFLSHCGGDLALIIFTLRVGGYTEKIMAVVIVMCEERGESLVTRECSE
eukprot:COSAG02_NODE_36129_length_458_cov_1.325905_1_plen_75_part_10